MKQYAKRISALAQKIWPSISHLETPGAAADVLVCLVCMILEFSNINGRAEARMAIEEFGDKVFEAWQARLDS